MARRLTACWAVALSLVLGAAGCTRHGGAANTPTSVRRAGPATGSVIRVGVPAEPASLNPFDVRSRTLAANDVLRSVLPQLFVVQPDGSVKGSLADDSTVKESRSSVSFSLRKGATWSDARPITADDVRFSLEAIRSDAWGGPRDGYDDISAVEGTDRKVTLRFSSPVPPGWRRLFSGDDYVLPAHRLRGQPLATVWATGPDIASGPLKLAGVTPGLEVDLDAVPNWWGGSSVQYSRVRLLVVPDVRTMEQLLGRGDLDVAWPPATTNRVGRFKALSGVTVGAAPAGGQLVSLYANTDKLNVARRHALLALMDRDRFVSVLLGDNEADPAVSWVPRVSATEGDVWRTVKADPESARTAISATFTATLAGADYEPLASLVGRAVQTRLLGTQATLDLAFTDAAEVAGSWLPAGRYELFLTEEMQWPQPCWRCRFAADSVGRGGWAREKSVDALALVADRDTGAAARRAVESRLRDEAAVLPLWRPRAVVATRGVHGVNANSWAPGPLWDVVSWSPSK